MHKKREKCFENKNKISLLKNKSGQVTIFIIIGIVIVVFAVLVYMFYPKIKSNLGIQESTPQSYIQSCVEDKLRETVNLISLQGGSVNPSLYQLYKDEKIEYLCYTEEFFSSCVIQQPMLKNHIESEIKKEISATVDDCFSSLERSYSQKGYDVDLMVGTKIVELLPKKIISTFNNSLIIKKGDDVQSYKSFIVVLNNNLYELVAIANSIIEWEGIYGEAGSEIYMTYYPNIKVEKILRDSGDKIYIVTDRTTGDKLRFAVRSQVWPAGDIKF